MLVLNHLDVGVWHLGPDGVVGAGRAGVTGLEDYTPSCLHLLWCMQLCNWFNSDLCRICEEEAFPSLECSLLITKCDDDSKYKPETDE